MKAAWTFMVEARERGLALYQGTGSGDGLLGDHVLITPPMTVRREESDKNPQYCGMTFAEIGRERGKDPDAYPSGLHPGQRPPGPRWPAPYWSLAGVVIRR